MVDLHFQKSNIPDGTFLKNISKKYLLYARTFLKKKFILRKEKYVHTHIYITNLYNFSLLKKLI